MTRALVIKELRELTAILVIAGLAAIFILAARTGFPLLPGWSRNVYWTPFINDEFEFTAVAIFGGCLALALGLKQTAWEAHAGTYYFLLHRPLAWRRVFGVKLAVGLALTLLLPAIVILLYASWAAKPGTHGDPFQWSMTGESWHAWLALPLAYLGAFASGIRPARWFGTRLAPLAVGVAAALFVGAISPWWIGAPAAAAALALLSATIVDAVKSRDW